MALLVMLLLAGGGGAFSRDAEETSSPAPERSMVPYTHSESESLYIQQLLARATTVVNSKAYTAAYAAALFDELLGEAKRPGSPIDLATATSLATTAHRRLHEAVGTGVSAAVEAGGGVVEAPPPPIGPTAATMAKPPVFPADKPAPAGEAECGGPGDGDVCEELTEALVIPAKGLLAAGMHHTCATRQDGTVSCWGRNQHGQSVVPEHVGRVSQLAVGCFHSCAVRQDGPPTVRCWGKPHTTSRLSSAPGGGTTMVLPSR